MKKVINNDDTYYNNNKYYDLANSKSTSKKNIKDILTAFSIYLVNYDKDYLYNCKFIESHIDDFFKSLGKTRIINEQCEKIKTCITNPKKQLLEFIKVIKDSDNANLSIILNGAIEISSTNKNDKEFIKISKNNLPPLKYDNELDIEIIFGFEKIEYRRVYNKVLISEVSEELQNINGKNTISIEGILNEILDQFADYIIKLNKLDRLIGFLDYFDYNYYNMSNIVFNFGDVFEYCPIKCKEWLGKFSNGSFKFLLKRQAKLDVDYWTFSFYRENKLYTKKSSENAKEINELEFQIRSLLNKKIVRENFE